MMARSHMSSTQRPDTLVRDRITPPSPISLATHRRSIHPGHDLPVQQRRSHGRCTSDNCRSRCTAKIFSLVPLAAVLPLTRLSFLCFPLPDSTAVMTAFVG